MIFNFARNNQNCLLMAFSSTVFKTSAFSLIFYMLTIFTFGHFNRCIEAPDCDFNLLVCISLMMVSIFSCAYLPSAYLLWWSIHSNMFSYWISSLELNILYVNCKHFLHCAPPAPTPASLSLFSTFPSTVLNSDRIQF